ncbi:hypothetical protein LFYK43_07930 [Ligilactobacillus salitolerans]|uniref:Uncharacterized protein n=1 Tax=Ligilactobacillus salitolerans TaxID=1808352 RepID=A0A401IS47_9LACO|nr:hypothetical protein LFYK43_07930 [Ligilactobacillus salitolerans]
MSASLTDLFNVRSINNIMPYNRKEYIFNNWLNTLVTEISPKKEGSSKMTNCPFAASVPAKLTLPEIYQRLKVHNPR